MSKYLQTDFLFSSELLVSEDEKSDTKKKHLKLLWKETTFKLLNLYVSYYFIY